MACVTIENIVASTYISEKLDIENLAKVLENVKYNPDEFKGLSLYFDVPKSIVFVFPDGKIVCTGAKSIDDIEDLMLKTINMFEEVGVSVNDEPEAEILNIIASSEFNIDLNLDNIANNPLLENVEYNTDKFPGLVYKIDESEIVLLIFSSGKVVCTGANKYEDASDAINSFEDKLTSIGVL
jgi:transcription initiation factor TFIID TATA-box-binding protein